MTTPRYTVQIKGSAKAEMDALPAKVWHRIDGKIRALAPDPRPRGCVKLEGTRRYRIRVGPYRVLYSVDDAARVIEIVGVGHRRDVYRNI